MVDAPAFHPPGFTREQLRADRLPVQQRSLLLMGAQQPPDLSTQRLVAPRLLPRKMIVRRHRAPARP